MFHPKKVFLTPLLEDLTYVCTVVSSAYSTERNIVQKKPNCPLTLMRYITDLRLKIPGTGVQCIVDI